MRGTRDNLCHSGQVPARVLPLSAKTAIGLRIAPLARLLTGALMSLLILPLVFAVDSAEGFLAAGRVDQALQTLEQQVRAAPTAESYNLLCRAHFEVGAWDAGIPACEKSIALAPGNDIYHLWLARIDGEKASRAGFWSAEGLAKKCRNEFERAVQLAPNNWEARADLAEFYLEAPGVVGGGKDKARAQAALIAPLNPGMAHWVKGRIFEKNKDPDNAEQEYRVAIEASHGGARAWLNLAGFYHHMNRLREMDLALHTLESSPLDHPGALVDGAGILLRSGRDYQTAARLLRRYFASSTVEEAPAFKAHCLLGEVFEKQGDRAAAAEEYRTALAMAHTYRPAQEGLRRATR